MELYITPILYTINNWPETIRCHLLGYDEIGGFTLPRAEPALNSQNQSGWPTSCHTSDPTRTHKHQETSVSYKEPLSACTIHLYPHNYIHLVYQYTHWHSFTCNGKPEGRLSLPDLWNAPQNHPILCLSILKELENARGIPHFPSKFQMYIYIYI